MKLFQTCRGDGELDLTSWLCSWKDLRPFCCILEQNVCFCEGKALLQEGPWLLGTAPCSDSAGAASFVSCTVSTAGLEMRRQGMNQGFSLQSWGQEG